MIKDLKEVFLPEWRVQSAFSKGKEGNREHYVACVAFFTKEKAIELLDEKIGSENWQKTFKSLAIGNTNTIICQIGIKNQYSEWIWREDAGESVDEENGIDIKKDSRSRMTSAFKRACNSWGIGHFLKSLGTVNLKANMSKEDARKNKQSPMPIDDSGKIIWNVSEYINNMPQIKKKLEELKLSDNKYKLKKLHEKLYNEYLDNSIESLSKCSTLDDLKQVRSFYSSLEDLKEGRYTNKLKNVFERIQNENK